MLIIEKNTITKFSSHLKLIVADILLFNVMLMSEIKTIMEFA